MDVLTLTIVQDHDSTIIDQYGTEHMYHGYDGDQRYWFKHGMPYLDFIVAANRGGCIVNVDIERHHGYMLCSIRRDDGMRTRFVRNDKSFRSRITMDALVEVHPGDFILYLDYSTLYLDSSSTFTWSSLLSSAIITWRMLFWTHSSCLGITLAL